MKRLVFSLIVVAAMLGADVARADDPLIPAATFGDGWSVEVTVQDDPQPGSWRTRLAFFGPDGNRVLVLAYDLNGGIDERSAAWQSVTDALARYSGASPEMIAMAAPDVPDPMVHAVSDAIRFACLDVYGRVCATSAYAAINHPVALIVRVDGTANGLTDLAATDYVAGLYFAALAD